MTDILDRQDEALVITPALTDEQQAVIDGLLELAAFLQSHPQFMHAIESTTFLQPVYDEAEFARLVSELGGRRTKEVTEKWMNVTRSFGVIDMTLFIARDAVCTKRVTGVETIRTPDPEALKAVPMIEVEKEIVEWDCNPILAEVMD